MPSPRQSGGPPAEPPDRPHIRWKLVRDQGTAAAFHARDPDPDDGHQLWIRRLDRPALILGSTQPDTLVRTDRAEADGIEVCRRRSGGGLVYLDPATDCWLDAIVPSGSPLWHDDVGLAFHWLGQRWAATLDSLLGPAGPALMIRPRQGRASRARPLWCFATLGHGEVTIGASKVVGLSQRRTRHVIRLQSLVLGAWPGRRLLRYLDPDVIGALVEDGRLTATDGVDPSTTRPGDSSDVPRLADPGRVRAGPPPGIRLPGPDDLAAAFLDQTRRSSVSVTTEPDRGRPDG